MRVVRYLFAPRYSWVVKRVWPLTGRDAELGEIRAALSSRAGPRGIVLAGPAGVGKTRLAGETAASTRGRTVWVHGSIAARQFPLGAFAGVVPPPGGDPARVVTDVVEHVVGEGDVVLVVDDAHLLDELSAVAVQRLAGHAGIAVILTLRDDTSTPDAVTALWKDGVLLRLDIAPLSREHGRALVTRVLDGPVDSAAQQRLWELTRGSPLFLRHLVAAEVASGRLARSAGVWGWTGTPSVSDGLSAIVDGQIGELPPDVLDVLDLVAVAEPLPLPALTRLSAPTAPEDAEHRRVVRVEETPHGPVVRLAHPMYGEVRRARMGVVRARRLRGLAAGVLTAPGDRVRRAVLILGSDLPPDPALFFEAAREAIGLADVELAERLAGAAVSAGAGADARLVHASSLSWLSRGVEAEQVLESVTVGDLAPDLRELATAVRVGNLLWTLRRPDAAEQVLDDALATGSLGHPPLMLRALRVAVDTALGRVGPVVERSAELAHLEHPLTVALLASAVAAAAAVLGRVDLLPVTAAAVIRAGGGAGATIPRFGLGDWQVLGYRLAGRCDDAARVGQAMRELGTGLPGPPRLMGLVVAGHGMLAAGRPAAALVPLQEAWAGFGTTTHEFRWRCRTLLLLAAGQTGDTAATGPLRKGVAHDPHPTYTLYRPDDLLALAWAAAADGRTTRAGIQARQAATFARSQGSPAYEVLAWQTAVQLGAITGAVARLTALATVVDSPRAHAALAHASALAAPEGDALLAAADRWHQLGDLVAAGDAAAQAAAAYRRADRRGSAASATARAQLLGEASGARTPALAAAATPLPLTAREREIVALAARGWSNREIAASLTVSVRTVEGHVYRAGQKLGVSHRQGFATVLGPPGAS